MVCLARWVFRIVTHHQVSPRPGPLGWTGMFLSRLHRVRRVVVVILALLVAASLAGLSRAADASVLPSGFQDAVALRGMTNPTVVQFAPDGRIFVGQKNGMIKVFSSLTDTNPVT